MLEKLINLFRKMDGQWNKIADIYDFQCNGCEDNCCQSLFFHHTHIEKAYIIQGFNRLDSCKQTDIKNKANEYIRKTFSTAQNIKSLKIMCPLNEEGKCVLYLYRPMICRLHGLPHEIWLRGDRSVFGEGCKAGCFNDKPYIKFDRTPFYQEMAGIEASWRKETGQTDKIKETVAHMIL